MTIVVVPCNINPGVVRLSKICLGIVCFGILCPVAVCHDIIDLNDTCPGGVCLGSGEAG